VLALAHPRRQRLAGVHRGVHRDAGGGGPQQEAALLERAQGLVDLLSWHACGAGDLGGRRRPALEQRRVGASLVESQAQLDQRAERLVGAAGSLPLDSSHPVGEDTTHPRE